MDLLSVRLPVPGSVYFETKYAYIAPPVALSRLPPVLNDHGKDGWEPVHVEFGRDDQEGRVVGVLLKRSVTR